MPLCRTGPVIGRLVMACGLIVCVDPWPAHAANRVGSERTSVSPVNSSLAASDEPSDSLRSISASEVRAALVYDVVRSAPAVNGRRSVPLALGMSAVVPGLGQAYNDQWIKGAALFAVEAGLVAGYLIWRSRGLDQEQAYINYAHEHWSADRYARWLNDYVEYLEAEHGASIGAGPISIPEHIDFASPESWTAQQRSDVRQFFDRIRAVEGQVFHPETGASFSHKLPYFGEQQYYELIGKYFQFAPGWVDYPDWRIDGSFTGAIDPERKGPNGERVNIQGRFLEYARDHADANSLLRRASRVSAVILLNHIVAAFDAAVAAKLNNDRLTTDLSLRYDALGRPVMLATARWSF